MHFQQALVLSHEMAPVGSRMPYLATVCQPMVPFVVYGRSARMEPQCPGEDAVSWAWRDTVLPIIIDPCLPIGRFIFNIWRLVQIQQERCQCCSQLVAA